LVCDSTTDVEDYFADIDFMFEASQPALKNMNIIQAVILVQAVILFAFAMGGYYALAIAIRGYDINKANVS
jgi:high-affinity K+ transport system ATPase subunit B